MRRLLPVLVVAAAVAALPAAAHAAQSTRLDVAAELLGQPPGRPWSIDLRVTATVATPDGSPPSSLRTVDISFPHASLNDGRFPTCSTTVLRTRGPRACPAGSRVGHGAASADVRPLIETPVPATIDVFNGPRRGRGRVLLFDTRATSPVSLHMVLEGLLRPTAGRYGYRLTLAIPPIATIPGSPPAAVDRFDVTVGARRGGASFLEAPRSCPRDGLPFAGRFGYADGTSSSVTAALRCVLTASSAAG